MQVFNQKICSYYMYTHVHETCKIFASKIERAKFLHVIWHFLHILARSHCTLSCKIMCNEWPLLCTSCKNVQEIQNYVQENMQEFSLFYLQISCTFGLHSYITCTSLGGSSPWSRVCNQHILSLSLSSMAESFCFCL